MSKPYKEIDLWISSDLTVSLSSFNHLFPFIKWEDKEPWSIKELLEE